MKTLKIDREKMCAHVNVCISKIMHTSIKVGVQMYVMYTNCQTLISDKTEIILTVQSCKLCNNKYMIASTQIINTEIFPFIAVLVFTLLSHKVFFINRNNNRNCYKVGYFLRKQQISWINYCKIIKNSLNMKFSGYF